MPLLLVKSSQGLVLLLHILLLLVVHLLLIHVGLEVAHRLLLLLHHVRLEPLLVKLLLLLAEGLLHVHLRLEALVLLGLLHSTEALVHVRLLSHWLHEGVTKRRSGSLTAVGAKALGVMERWRR